jgi:hypothetical protein
MLTIELIITAATSWLVTLILIAELIVAAWYHDMLANSTLTTERNMTDALVLA